ncbi:hypothetical protein VNO77_02022 [Canavalia gladiata]|uniref:Uncharacterized protein n=1 Tax=Canavalia gladiata TaxID=3824 RepID=A0AAN9R2N5_CANGL
MASASAFNDYGDSDHLHASVSVLDQRLSSYAFLVRASIDVTIPFLMRVFSNVDMAETLEELYIVLLIIGYVNYSPGGRSGLNTLTSSAQNSFESHPMVADARESLRRYLVYLEANQLAHL